MVVPAAVAAVRPAGTNHAFGHIKVVVVICGGVGFVGGPDDVGGDDVRTSGDGAGNGGGGRPDHLDQAPGEPSETATASHQWWTRRCLTRWWVRQQLKFPLLLLFRPFHPQYLVIPPPHHPSQLSFVHFPFLYLLPFLL